MQTIQHKVKAPGLAGRARASSAKDGTRAEAEAARAGTQDRVYIIYGMNVGNTTRFPGTNKTIGRTDCQGQFVMRWSDDGGETFSQEHVVVPYRLTAVDRGNDFVRRLWPTSSHQPATATPLRRLWPTRFCYCNTSFLFYGAVSVQKIQNNNSQVSVHVTVLFFRTKNVNVVLYLL